jgi:hypothetical protein
MVLIIIIVVIIIVQHTQDMPRERYTAALAGQAQAAAAAAEAFEVRGGPTAGAIISALITYAARRCIGPCWDPPKSRAMRGVGAPSVS